MCNYEIIARAYLEACEWADCQPDNDEAFSDCAGFSDDAWQHAKQATQDFAELMGDDFEKLREALTDEQIGRDLYLTRVRHGAGFWDRGLGEIGVIATKWAESLGEVWPYVGDDGEIYIS